MCIKSDETLPGRIDDLPRDRFVEGWTAIVGEPPSIMLDGHRRMIEFLVGTVPSEPDGDAVAVAPPSSPAASRRSRDRWPSRP